MAEPQKTDPPVKSKEKSSLLDIDIDKDFLGSWRSMSMGDDGMDFDFGPTTKGKQKAFNFDKMDMDFSVDDGFDKLSSFKMDMPGFDISSPAKKSGKSTEKSKDISSGGAKQSKRESFGFSFDFDGFADLGFESKKTKIDETSNKSKDKEGHSNASISGGSGDFLATKDVDASKDDDVSSKHPASRGVTNSKVDTQKDNSKDPDPRTEDANLKSVIDESSLLKAANSEEQQIQRTIEPIQESPSSEKRYSPEPVVQKVVQDSYVHSEDINICTEGTFSDAQEDESRTSVRVVSPSKRDEKNDNMRPVAELVPTRNISAHMETRRENSETCEMRDDNATTEHIDGSDVSKDTSKADLHPESYVTPGIENLTNEEMADKRNADSCTELQGNLLGSGTAVDELATDKERGNFPVRSKYFIKQNGSESELQQASASSTKLISISNKRTNTLPSNPALEKREFGSRSLESGSKFTGVSRSLPKVLSKDIPVQSKDIPVQTDKTEAGHVKSLDNTREALSADNIRSRSESVVSTVAHDISLMKEKPVLKGNDQISANRSDVQPSSSIEQLRKNISLNIINPGTSTHNMRKAVVKEKNRISPTKVEMKASEVSTSRVSKPTELKPKPLNSLLLKGLTSVVNKDKCPELQGNTVFKRNLPVGTKKQTPPTPTLKRKAFEVDIPRLTPVKRLSASPCSNKMTASSEKADGEQGCNHTSMAHAKSPRLDVSLTEMDISSIENDGIFEKAEACSKELEDICNMLKKKHEEANDLLVRAIRIII
ncbi:hypothetical protein M8C21_021984 [Ambrosia artemisiifolia]|uniref:Uncharacterized protein n=1 Tax=Ambrosia artemisiifolia TaxID=4212 RepID=A0AAD5CHZ3_AMBAR|nr:hypothetical protein M8C21_021984 [Ambrosia artemisiifolia]